MNMTPDERKGWWTEAEIQKRLGTSTGPFPPDVPVGAREIARIRSLGIQAVELCGLHTLPHFDHRNGAQVKEIMDECRKQGVEIVAVHAPELPGYCGYDRVRKAVVEEWVACARVAEEMGASVFVAHFGISDYSAETAHEMLDELDDCHITLTVENGLDLQAYKAFVERIGSDRFGMTVDIGHPRDEDGMNPFVKKERAREAISLFDNCLSHIHLHDFIEGDHYAPFDGYIQWRDIFAALREIDYAGTLMFEAGDRISLEDTLTKVAAFPKEFARRYPN